MRRLGSAVLLAVIGVAFAGVTHASGQQVTSGSRHASNHLNHVIKTLPDGGSIELQAGADDTVGVAHIRRHLQESSRTQCVPGIAVPAAKRDAITYTYRELPRGGEVRIVTQDPQALQAIHESLAIQNQRHSARSAEHGRDHSRGANHGQDHVGQHHQDRDHHGGAHHGGTQEGCMHHGGANHGGT